MPPVQRNGGYRKINLKFACSDLRERVGIPPLPPYTFFQGVPNSLLLIHVPFTLAKCFSPSFAVSVFVSSFFLESILSYVVPE